MKQFSAIFDKNGSGIFFPVFSMYGIYEQIIIGNPIGEKPLSNDGLIWFTVLIGVGLPVLFYNIRLKK